MPCLEGCDPAFKQLDPPHSSIGLFLRLPNGEREIQPDAIVVVAVSVVTITLAYAYGDSLTNLIQPFFAIPILAVTRMKFGDVVGYTFLVAVACFAVTSVGLFFIPNNL